jgi:hypothetical protein
VPQIVGRKPPGARRLSYAALRSVPPPTPSQSLARATARAATMPTPAVIVREPDATMQPTPQDNQLMPKHRVLSFRLNLRLERRGHDGQNETEQPDHSASLGDSITSSTRIRFSVHAGAPPWRSWDPFAPCLRHARAQQPRQMLPIIRSTAASSGSGLLSISCEATSADVGW